LSLPDAACVCCFCVAFSAHWRLMFVHYQDIALHTGRTLLTKNINFVILILIRTASVIQWLEFSATDPEARVQFPAL
jgi:hypothetical protein